MTLLRLGPISLEWIWRDLWVGLFIKEPKKCFDSGMAWTEHHLYAIVIPTLVLHIVVTTNHRRITDGPPLAPWEGR